jgi:hypothetical protein
VGATGFLASGGQHPARANSQTDAEIARFIAGSLTRTRRPIAEARAIFDAALDRLLAYPEAAVGRIMTPKIDGFTLIFAGYLIAR